MQNQINNYVYDPCDFNFIKRYFSIQKIIDFVNNNQLILDESEWSLRKCSLFIESILIRIPLNPLYLDNTNGYYKIISGRNRIFALKLIMIDCYKLEGLEFLTDLNNLTFLNLTRKYQRRILESDLTVYIIEPGTPQFIIDNISRRIN